MTKVEYILNILEKDEIIKSVDMKGNKIELIFIRPLTKAEKSMGSAHMQGMRKIPDKSGWEKVYMPYGPKGPAFYYTRSIK